MNHIWEFSLVALVAALLQVASHYLPWRRLLGRELPRLAAYVVGVANMALPFGVFLGLIGAWEILVGMAAVIVISGIVVAGCYGLDTALAVREQRALIDHLEARHDQDDYVG